MINNYKDVPLIKQLFASGGEVYVEKGELIVKFANNCKDAVDKWLVNNRFPLIREICSLLPFDLYVYDSYSTGFYGAKKCSGVTLQFKNINTMAHNHVIFNANLKRVRSTKNGKAGTLLPKGQFTPPKGGAFLVFWCSTGLAFPPRMGAFHCYMGNLKKLIFVPEVNPMNKISNKSIPTLSISFQNLVVLMNSKSADNIKTTYGQVTDSIQTNSAYKEIASSYMTKGGEQNLTTGNTSCGISLNGSAGISDCYLRKKENVDPRIQTYEEWRNDYDEA